MVVFVVVVLRDCAVLKTAASQLANSVGRPDPATDAVLRPAVLLLLLDMLDLLFCRCCCCGRRWLLLLSRPR